MLCLFLCVCCVSVCVSVVFLIFGRLYRMSMSVLDVFLCGVCVVCGCDVVFEVVVIVCVVCGGVCCVVCDVV